MTCQGYAVDLYTYLPLDAVRRSVSAISGVRVLDARPILAAPFEFADKQGRRDADAYRYLPLSDLFRFSLLHARGGAWIDLDVFLLRPVPARIWNRSYAFCSERTIQKGAYANPRHPELAGIAFVKVPGPASPLTAWILEHTIAHVRTPFDYMVLFRRAVTALGLERYVLPAKAFFPLNWWDLKEATTTDKNTECFPSKYGVKAFCEADLDDSGVYGVHWFRAILRKRGLLTGTPAALFGRMMEVLTTAE